MSITEQEKRQTARALKEEIAYNAKMIATYESKRDEFSEIEGGEREVLRCELEIIQCRKAMLAAANSLGIKPPDFDAPVKRGPGRPPKNPA